MYRPPPRTRTGTVRYSNLPSILPLINNHTHTRTMADEERSEWLKLKQQRRVAGFDEDDWSFSEKRTWKELNAKFGSGETDSNLTKSSFALTPVSQTQAACGGDSDRVLTDDEVQRPDIERADTMNTQEIWEEEKMLLEERDRIEEERKAKRKAAEAKRAHVKRVAEERHRQKKKARQTPPQNYDTQRRSSPYSGGRTSDDSRRPHHMSSRASTISETFTSVAGPIHNIGQVKSEGNEEEMDWGDDLDNSTINTYMDVVSQFFDPKWKTRQEYCIVERKNPKTGKIKKCLQKRTPKLDEFNQKMYDQNGQQLFRYKLSALENNTLKPQQFRTLDKDNDWLQDLIRTQTELENHIASMKEQLLEFTTKKEAFVKIQVQQKDSAEVLLAKAVKRQLKGQGNDSPYRNGKATTSSTSFVVPMVQFGKVFNNFTVKLSHITDDTQLREAVTEYVLFKCYVQENISRNSQKNYLSGFKNIWHNHNIHTVTELENVQRSNLSGNDRTAFGAYLKFVRERPAYINKCANSDL